MMSTSLLLSFLVVGVEDKPPPLTEEQTKRIQVLVRSTQETMGKVRLQMDEKQRTLAKHYAEFDLDVDAVQKLQTEVVDLQKQLLTSYHGMHVELRKIVGRERFVTLRQRIDAILNAPPKRQ